MDGQERTEPRAHHLRLRRAARWAEEAARIHEGRSEDYLAEAWIIAERPRSNAEATALLGVAIARDKGNETDCRLPVDADRVDCWSPGIDAMETVVLERERRRAIAPALLSLRPIEHRVLAMRFGLSAMGDGVSMDESTLASIGEEIGVGGGRVRQIESKALRKLKHPSQSRALRPLIDFTENHDWGRGPDADPGWRYWDARMKVEGPHAQWDWHACPLTIALHERGALPPVGELVAGTKHVQGNNQWVVRTTIEHAGMSLVVSARPQVLMVEIATLSRLFQYQDRTGDPRLVAGYAGHRAIRGHIQMKPWTMPETISAGVVGRCLRDLVDHELLGGLTITAVDPGRGTIEVAGATRRLPPA